MSINDKIDEKMFILCSYAGFTSEREKTFRDNHLTMSALFSLRDLLNSLAELVEKRDCGVEEVE